LEPSKLLDIVQGGRLGAVDFGEIGFWSASERKSERDADIPGLAGASERLIGGRLETAPTARTPVSLECSASSGESRARVVRWRR
jgi:hypothetical protein